MTAQRAALPVTGATPTGKPNTHEGAAALDRRGAELLDGVRAAKSAAAKLTPVGTVSASDENVRRVRDERWSTTS